MAVDVSRSALRADYAVKRFRAGAREHTPVCTRSRQVRARSLLLIGILCIVLLIWRFASLQLTNFERWQDWALKQHFKDIEVASERGPVIDRNGKLLAVSIPAGSIYLRPKQIKDLEKIVKEVSVIAGVDEAAIRARAKEKKPFVWLKRQIPRATAEKLGQLALPGLGYVLESRRMYPNNESASSLIGRVNLDGVGQSGVEALFDSKLHSAEIKTRVGRDAIGNVIQLDTDRSDGFSVPRGEAVQLTLDTGLQLIVDQELAAGRDSASAKRAMAIIVDTSNGEILAMSQAPSVNFNLEKIAAPNDLKNAVVETVLEPGSTMKPIVAALALEEGVVTPTDMINCENGHFPFGKHTIKDVHPIGTVSFHDVVVRSSNIGMTKVGLRLGADRLYAGLRRFGFGTNTRLGLPGETPGILRDVKTWAKVDVATHSFGQGIAVTPLQMIRAVSALANGGILPQLHFVRDGKDYSGERVISEKTSAQVREMMFGVIEDEHGTGKKAGLEGVLVGGKTGTAQKAREGGRGYQSGAYIASFVGFVDAREVGISQRLALMVTIDEPKGVIYGGAVAAPIFKRIMQRSLHYLATRQELH